MNAYNLGTNKTFLVNNYKGVLYIDFLSGYLIIEKVDIKPSEIEKEHLYSYFRINVDIYDSFYTTDYKAFVKTQEQLRLF